MFEIDELFRAYYDARRNKRNTISQLRFELHLEENIVGLYKELCSRKYVVGRSVCFIINDSVEREVFAADFRDRVVHHFLYNRLSPYFERKFIYDSYSCRKGKGTLLGIRRLHHHMRSCSGNYSEDCYVLKLDLKSYFMNISRERLYSHIEESLPDNFEDKEFILWLTKEIIMAEPIVNCCVKGHLSDWKDLPVEKSLFYAKDGNGMPIGNLTSQLFSNIYLNGFDNWMKRTCRCQHYGRYVDDFYIVHNSKKYLLRLIPEIRRYLRQELGLCVHPDKFYLQHYMKGVRFLGAVVRPYCILPARRLKMNFRKTCHAIEKCAITPSMMRTRLNSYLGLLCNQSSYRLIQKELNRLSVPYMYGCFKMRSGRFKYSLYQFFCDDESKTVSV